MRLTLIEVPYHLGIEDMGTGAAPRVYLEAGAARSLMDAGHDVILARVKRPSDYVDELSAVLNVNAALAQQVRSTVAAGRLPVVLSGDCNAALGVMAGLGTQTTAVFWLDAHGDFNTPETTPSGYLDGMPLALTTGLCLKAEVWGRLGGDCVPEAHVAHVGGRDVDADEQRNLAASRVMVVPALELLRHGVEEALRPAMQPLARGRRLDRRPGEPGPLKDVYLHIDIDVLSGDHAPAVGFPAPGGLTPVELHQIIRLVGRTFRVRAVTLSGMDPESPDPDARTVASGLAALQAAIAAADPGTRP